MELSNVVLGGTCTQFKCDTWLLGDSYFGAGDSRIVGRLMSWGFSDGVLIDGLGGLNSRQGYAELLRLLNFGTPKRLVWYLGMNDNASIVEEYYPMLEDLCEANNIELIFNRIPVVPSRIVENSAVNDYVINSGKRYIDSYESVGANDAGEWHSGYLSNDGVHPSDTGAAALASRLLVDVPEILSK
jgi:lysophospholipase L1-like esterase